MEPTDIELMLRVRTGEIEAFRLLVTRYREPLRRFFAMLLADRSEADDCVQETLLRLWLLRERYEPTGKFSTYLFQIGKHHLLNQRKKYRAAPITAMENGALELLPATGPPLDLVVMQQERDARIRQAVAALPAHYRQVFTLCHDDGLRHAEIAAHLQIPVGTVKSRMAEALRRLRLALNEADNAVPGVSKGRQ
jgi:RNA polymerase sigma-70 factor (ECF subfamily)